MRRPLLALLALLVLAVPALAQQAPPAFVGRVSFITGKLAFHTAGETQWSAAEVNFPVAAGSSYWTGPQSRAEFRIGPQTIALAGNTALDIVELGEKTMKVALQQGRINVNLRELADGSLVEIALPRGAVRLTQAGTYDIEAGTQDQPARIAVFEGNARFAGGSLDTAIKAGDAAVIGGGDTLTAAVERAAPDEFVQWCRSRYDQPQRVAKPRRVSPRMTGYEELEVYGSWRHVPQYGEVWYPNDVPPGWVPYRHGRWVWVAPWGWTWVDERPWGFAPSHYGRWAHVDGVWGWVPGPVVDTPVYAPALVAFVDNPTAIVGSRAPVVGWFPLGPGEPYFPSYTADADYIRMINAGFVTDPAGLDRAAAAMAAANRAAATIVPQRAFANAAPVGRAALRMSEHAKEKIAAAGKAPDIRPGKMARGGSIKAASMGGPPGRGGGFEKAQGGGPKHAAGGEAKQRGGGTKHVAGGGKHGGGQKHFGGSGKHGGGPKHAAGGGKHGGGGKHFAGGGHFGGGGPKHFGGHFGGGGGKHGGGHGGGGKHGGGGGGHGGGGGGKHGGGGGGGKGK